MPKRIQRQRTKGWRMPEGVVYVGRPSAWGNPVRPGDPFRFTEDGEVKIIVPRTRHACAEVFARYLATRTDLHSQIREELGGRDLACWCPLPAPGEPDHCHAAVLLGIANT